MIELFTIWHESKPENPSGFDKSEYVKPYIPTQTPEENWSDHMQNHQADSPLYVWPDVWSADLQVYKMYGHK